MEGFLFQWDKACDAMPLLRPMSKLLLAVSLVILTAFVLPAIYMPENEKRPNPLYQGEYDVNKSTYVERVGVKPSEGRHNVESARIVEAVEKRDLIKLENNPNVVKQVLSGGIGRTRSSHEANEDAWDYKTEVAYIIPIGFEENKFKIDTGVFVDTRNLHKTGQYRQLVTLKAPTRAHKDLKNFEVNVTRMRDTTTQCIYYSMEIFGKRRLVLGGSDGKIEVNC